ncbi:MAG: RsmB/NOP family class I SAM-dependent RNA methyltransferase [Gammaproteobacteria bacterium]|nr:MAG: RsmB/NOP family class I SAM-dependent RNA methyltransferase [Gammaproteobacteria bacterium]
MAIPNKIPYDILFDLWRNWLMQNDWMPLDKWLKNHLRKNTNPKSEFASSQSNNRELSLCMFSAMRYFQLACAMEESYQKQELLNWIEWDKNWVQSSAKKIPVAGFWFWIALREKNENAGPKALRDLAARKAWFEKLEQYFSVTEQPEEILLWSGLRPQWLSLLEERKLKSEWSDEQLTAFITQQNIAPPLWLRVQKDFPIAEVVKKLQQDSVHVELDDDGHLFARGGKHLSGASAHKDGWVEIQDLASQQIALAIDVKAGQKVWDCCAGAGGKSLAIAARMKNKGVVIATDLHGYKLEELKRRSKRAEFHNIRSFEWAGNEPLRLPKEVAQQQGFDWVLVDAPCSSAGTWRRNPDARWRLSESDTQELIALQQQILTNAAKAVRNKGHLVYATCSWQVSENETQVEWFVKNNPEFILLSQTMLGAPQQDSDAMFVAVLQKA